MKERFVTLTLQALGATALVSFHMSGTEAVMQAVRLARYHTRRTHLVRFCGAYHGWWEDVQPGVGNPLPAHETHTLADMSAATLHVLRTRPDIACVLVNPIQSLHPNMAARADSSLVDSGRRAGFDKAAYGAWLKEVRAVCTERGIALIFDEVFLGFRLAPGGAQEYFRCAGRPRNLRQDARRRASDRRGVRSPRVHEALPRRPSG
jgi:glutamate-1-semialdehyde 2,1-aminomutase